mmetsp:Transcript_30040/g.48452  ORF Transcript_30040/g.48452 Transcript_30040/m.48452 type:complete len:499 (+) Transcript_30040:2-1498(+)
MATFYLVNWPDEDIRQISLEVLNSTISVFGALLLFHTLEDVLEHYLLPEMSLWQEVAVSMLQMLLWFAALQLVLAYYSGALGENQAVRLRSTSLSVAEACESPTTKWRLMKSADKHLGVIKLNTEAWGILLGHATGFAAKNACSSLQQAVPRSFFFVALTPLLFFGIIILFYHATECFRHKIMMRDGEEDEFEEIWHERVAETEDEVIALAVSFSIVQMLRFVISGHLPNASGEDAEGFDLHTNSSCALLLLVGLVPGVADVVRVMCTRSTNTFVRVVSGGGSEEERLRSRNWCEGISSMSFAWCIHFAVDWWIASHLQLEGSMKAVLSALTVTAMAFVLIFGLDKVADSNFDDVEVHHALRGMIAGLGLLVGFSWERCFDASLDGLAKHRDFGTLSPEVSRVVLAIALALLVLPAWKWFILPMPSMPQVLDDLDDPTPKIKGKVKDEAQTGSKRRLFGRIGSSMSSLGETETRRQYTRGFSTLSNLSTEDSVNLLTA